MRTYYLDKMVGPSSSGDFQMVCKDPLYVMDDKKTAPLLSNGRLSNELSEAGDVFYLNPIGIGDAEYPSSGYMALGGNEIIEFTRSGDTVNVIERAVFNTVLQSHDADSRAQVVIEYPANTPSDIVYSLMTEYGGISPSLIIKNNWDAEVNEFIQRNFTGIIAEPVPVVDLINEILSQSAMSLWWDELRHTIKLQALRAQGESNSADDDFFMSGSFSQKDQADKRVSRVWSYYGMINPLESSTDPKNFKNASVSVSLESEEDYGTPMVKKIFCRWISRFGRPAAEALNASILQRYVNAPRKIQFSLLRDDFLPTPELGSIYRLRSLLLQKPTGETDTIQGQVTSVKTDGVTYKVEVEELKENAYIAPPELGLKVVTIDIDEANFVLSRAYAQLYPEPLAGDIVRVIVRSGVIVYSLNTGIPALIMDFARPDVSVELVIDSNSVIAGAGGKGGNASASQRENIFVESGGNGGVALLATQPFSLVNQGIIGGGGGGGGGSASAAYDTKTFSSDDGSSAASGGGGGAGYGSGGSASASNRNGAQSFPGGAGSLQSGGETRNAYHNGGRAVTSAKGGLGGGLGQNGLTGSASNRKGESRNASGGLAGKAIQGFENVTIIQAGTILGATS
jgi:hypothetical protein